MATSNSNSPYPHRDFRDRTGMGNSEQQFEARATGSSWDNNYPPWWAWLIWVPVVGTGAFFVPHGFVTLAFLVGAPAEALRPSDDEPAD